MTDKTVKKQINQKDEKPWLFKKGQSGNPEGRPKGTISFTSAIKRFLKEHPEVLKEIMMDYIKNKKHRELLWKMIDGMPKQQIQADIEGERDYLIIVGSKEEAQKVKKEIENEGEDNRT